MSWTSFYNRVIALGKERHKAVWIKPNLELLPLPIQRYDEPFFPLSKAIVQATQSSVGLYVFDMASYLATGAAGIVALERAIAYTKDKAITILHGPFTGESYTVLADDISFTVDALTVTRQSDLNFYIENMPHAAFLWNDDISDGEGGIFDETSMSLHQSNSDTIDIPVLSSIDLLTDLSDSFMNSMKQYVSN